MAKPQKSLDLDIEVGALVPPKLRQWYRMDRDKSDQWRIDAQEDFDFKDGRQYSAEELAVLRKKRRPDITFNRVGTIVDAVTGYEIGNRREVRYIPRELGDVQANEVLTGAGEWFNDRAKGDYVRSAVFSDVVVCGMGWSETRIDFMESPEGEPREDHLDVMEMGWDRDARARNLADATRVHRTRRIPLAEAMEMFPGRSRDELNAAWTNVNSEADLKRTEAGREATGGEDYVTIVQFQYVTRETYYLAEDPMTGEQSEFTAEEFNTANKRLKQLVGIEMEGVRFRKRIIKQCFLGSVVLSYGDAPCPTEFSLQCVTGKFDRNKGTWYGLVRAMKDPQRWANKWLAQMMFIMNSNSKGGLLAEKRAFANPREAEKTWAEPDAVTLVEDGALSNNMVKEKQQAPFPVGFQQLTEFAISSIRDVSGVNQELLGLRDAEQPGVLEAQRKQAGMNILQWAFDGMKLYSEKQGTVVLYYIQNDLSDGRLIRIVGKDGEKYVPLVKQADAEYDIIVDDAPTSPNQKEQVWGIVSAFLPMVGKIIPPQYILKALKYSPLPASIVSELEEMANAPNPEAQEAKAMAAKAAAAAIDKDLSSANLNNAKAREALTPEQQANDNSALEWRKAVLDAVTKIEVALIQAESASEKSELEVQLKAILGLSGLNNEHALQMRQLAHDRAMQRMKPAQEAVS